MNAEWWHYAMVYGMWVGMFLLACGLVVYPFRKKRGRR